MKKTMIALAILLAANTGSFAQDNMHRNMSHTHKMVTKKYTCPMHHEVVRSKQGKCPKCGMKMVAMKSKKTTKSMHGMKM